MTRRDRYGEEIPDQDEDAVIYEFTGADGDGEVREPADPDLALAAIRQCRNLLRVIP
jgi:hypothetical protein